MAESIVKRSLPSDALLARYLKPGYYTDCYTVDVPLAVSQRDYIAAFYTTWLFKLERAILKYVVSKPSSDEDAEHLAEASRNSFAAWTVEDRSESQLLMCDFRGRTRSWLQTTVSPERKYDTRLFFGSAVVPNTTSNGDPKPQMPGFGILLGFHKLYSRALLHSARSRLIRQRT